MEKLIQFVDEGKEGTAIEQANAWLKENNDKVTIRQILNNTAVVTRQAVYSTPYTGYVCIITIWFWYCEDCPV